MLSRGERDRARGHAEALAAARQQARALLLEQLAAAHLAAQDARQAHDRVHVARADRRALLEHDRQQAARRGDLRVEVREHLAAERAILAGRAARAARSSSCAVPPVSLAGLGAGVPPLRGRRPSVRVRSCPRAPALRLRRLEVLRHLRREAEPAGAHDAADSACGSIEESSPR